MIHAYVEPHENTNPEMIKNIKKMYIALPITSLKMTVARIWQVLEVP